MTGWTVGLIAGAVVIIAVASLCAFVLRALRATAETTQELARALEQVQANTAALGRLDQATSSIQEISRGLAATLDAGPQERSGRAHEQS